MLQGIHKRKPLSPEHKAKISAALKGRSYVMLFGEEEAVKLKKVRSKFFKGRKLTEEQKKRISQRQKGIKNWHFGKHWSPEIKEKIKLSNIGKKRSSETKRKNSQASKRLWREGKMKNVKIFKVGQKPAHYGKHLPKITGPNHYNWKGGSNRIEITLRNSLEYQLWRRAVFKRDDFSCQDCGKRGGNLNADHIKSFAMFPELRFDIDNGRTLCVPCHKETETYGLNQYKIEKLRGEMIRI